jgi:hypothetical protein
MEYLVFFIVYGLTAAAFWSERKARIALESQMRWMLSNMTTQASAIANTASDLNVHLATKEKIRQLLEMAPASQCQHVLRHFKDNYSEIPWEHVERAFNEVRRELTNQEPIRQ